MKLSTKFEDCGCVLGEIPPPNIDVEIFSLATMCDHSFSEWIDIIDIDPDGDQSVPFGIALGQCILTLCEDMERTGNRDTYMPHSNRFFFKGLNDIFGLVFVEPGQMAIKWNHCPSGGPGTFHQEMSLMEYRNMLAMQEILDAGNVIVVEFK